jgi:putative SbcD/Mre11-related phosphoesterase
MLQASFFPPMEIVFDNRCLVVRSSVLNALLVSDIHLGFHIELERLTGVAFPSEQASMLEQLQTMIRKYSVSALYVIGDFKHTITPDSSFNWETIPDFMKELSREVETTIIPGNHDGAIEALLPRKVKVADVRGLVIGNDDDSIGLVHGHAWPSAEVLRPSMIVVGHNHPSLNRIRAVSTRLNGRRSRRRSVGSMPVLLRSKLNKNCVRKSIGVPEDPEDPVGVLMTLPCFNTLLSGIQVNQPDAKLQGPMFESGCTDLGSSEVYSTDGVFLGTVDALQVSVDETIKWPEPRICGGTGR